MDNPTEQTEKPQPNTDDKYLKGIIKKDDGFLAYYFSAQLAYYLVQATKKLSLRPNHFTAISLVLGLLAAGFFSMGDYTSLVIGVIVLNISFICDCADGQLSRLKGLQSKMGHWFDYHSDKLKDGALLLGLAYGAFINSGSTLWWIFVIVFAAIFFQFMRNITALNRDNFKLEQEGKKDKAHSLFKASGKNQLFVTLKNSALFKLSDRVLLFTAFVLLDQVVIGLVVYAALELFFSSMSAFINYKTFSRFDKKNNS
ncbi:CDP-alcohol phosphatidyltransferase family protein [Patescibacteria group bacterium]